jgi:hypothetical protein
MKAGSVSVAQMISRAEEPKSKSGPPDFGALYAVPASETTQDSDLTRQLMARLFTYQEAFYYFQRAMMAGVSPDCVLEGEFGVAIIADKVGDHPFDIRCNGQRIHLQPHDGFGFIRRSVAEALPAFAGKHAVFGAEHGGRLPAQALQHYPRSPQVVRETVETLGAQLTDRTLSGQDRHHLLTAGGIKGELAIAVPSANSKLYLPHGRCEQGGGDGGILLGRSPYDKPNLRPIRAERVGRAQSDPTADFLSRLCVLQYSLVGQEQAAAKPLTFFKGLIGVLDDQLWPAAYQDQQIVFSAEDQKMHSHWKTGKNKVADQQGQTLRAILVAKQLFAPGSAVAVPIEEQKKLDGDFDGDPVLLLAGRPRLWELVERHEAQPADRRFDLKPQKTFTPAEQENGRYRYGRASRILSAKGKVLEDFVTLQNVFLGLDDRRREQIAARIVAEMVDMDMLPAAQVPADAAQTVCQVGCVLSQGIKVGTDAYKSNTETCRYAQLAKQIRILFHEQDISLSVPYGKSFARHLAGDGPGPELITQKRAQLQSNPTLAAAIMEKTLAMLPTPT